MRVFVRAKGDEKRYKNIFHCSLNPISNLLVNISYGFIVLFDPSSLCWNSTKRNNNNNNNNNNTNTYRPDWPTSIAPSISMVPSWPRY